MPAPNSKPLNLNARRGFTIIELLIGIAILAILSTVSIYVFRNSAARSRDSVRKSDLKKIVNPLALYYSEHNAQYPPDPASYPGTLFTSQAGGDWIPGMMPSYMKKLPLDPKQASISIASQLASFIEKKFAGKNSGQVAATTVVTIHSDFDGYSSRFSCSDASSTLPLEGGSSTYRPFFKFSLDLIPAGATITEVTFEYRVTSSGTSSSSLQAYNSDGQADPQSDSCSQKRTRSANDSSPYIQNGNLVGSSGVKRLTLPAQANSDLENAKSNVNRFTLAMNEGSSSSSLVGQVESIEHSGSNEGRLTITYQTVTPSPTPSPSPSPTPSPTPSPSPSPPPPSPSPSPSPSPTPSPSPAPISFYFGYQVTADRKSYVLWATLEKQDDPEIYSNPKAHCKETPPPNTPFNFCIKPS